MIINYLIVFCVSFLISTMLTPILRLVAIKKSIMDAPVGFAKKHKKPTPYLGGLAITFGTLVPLLIFYGKNNLLDKYILGMIICGFTITAVGVFDDLYDLKPSSKLFFQLIISIATFYCGYRLQIVPVIFISFVLTVSYILGSCNAINLIDGLDGLATGVSTIASLFFFLIGYKLNNYLIATLALAMMGSSMGFLIYNFNPASIFMGDAGSLFIGYCLAIMMILISSKPYDIRLFLIPIFICGLPIADNVLTLIRRYVNNRPLFPADRSHFYDQLVDRGFSIKKTVFICYLASFIFGLIALSFLFLPTYIVLIISAITVLLILFLIIKHGFIKMGAVEF